MSIVEGSIVQLKSGGPDMTVISLTAGAYAPDNAPKDQAFCRWFGKGGTKAESDTFPLSSLLLIE